MSDEFRIADLSHDAAKKYLLEVLTSKQVTKKQLEGIKENIDKWQKRFDLATAKNVADLAAEAEKQLTNFQTDYEKVQFDLQEIEREESRVRDQMKITKGEIQKSVDTEILADQLENLAGPVDTTTESIKDIGADEELSELKRKLGMEDA